MRLIHILSFCKCFILCCACFVFSVCVEAQNTIHYDKVFYKIDSTRTEGDLLLRMSDVSFFKNNEYFSDFIEGYTLIGYRLQPSLVYYLKKSESSCSAITLEIGCNLLHYGGKDRYDKVYPTATAQWQINPVWTLIMGTIDGHAGHSLPESMWDSERQIVDKPEMGVQMKFVHKFLKGEAWLNWQQFIKRYDTIPEKFTAGLSIDITPQSESSLYLFVPVRLIISHIGGQISDYSERMQSLANGLVSFQIGFQRKDSRFKQMAYADIEGQFYHAMVDRGVRPFSDGTALYPKICYLCNWEKGGMLSANVGLWIAKNYFSLYGNPSYMSLSNYKSDIYSERRNMFIYNVDYSYSISDLLRFSVGTKGYFDNKKDHFDYSYNVSLILTPHWRLTNISRLLNTIN